MRLMTMPVTSCVALMAVLQRRGRRQQHVAACWHESLAALLVASTHASSPELRIPHATPCCIHAVYLLYYSLVTVRSGRDRIRVYIETVLNRHGGSYRLL